MQTQTLNEEYMQLDSSVNPLYSLYNGEEDGYEDQQLPPGYASGSTIEVAPTNKGLYNPVVRVHVESTSPQIDVNQTLMGKVILSPKTDLEFSRLVVDFIGEEISQRVTGFNQTRYTRRFQLAQYVVPPSLFPEENIVRDGMQYTLSFSLTIPNHAVHETDCRCKDDALARALHMQLPPAYGASIELNVNAKDDVPDLSAKIIYKIRARLYKPLAAPLNPETSMPMEWHAQSTRMIPLRPSVYPPVDASILLDDTGQQLLKPIYRVDAPIYAPQTPAQYLLPKSKKKQLGTIHMSIHRPITMFLLQQNTSSVSLDLRFTQEDLTDGKCNIPPPQITSVAYSVSELTYSSTKATGMPPSRNSLAAQKNKKVKTLHCFEKRVARQKLTIAAPRWELVTESAEDCDGNDSQDKDKDKGVSYQTSLNFPLLCLSQESVPTYFACLTSRQYELTLSVYLKGHSNKVELQVPVLVTNYSFPDTGAAQLSFYGPSNSLGGSGAGGTSGGDGFDYAPSSKTSFSYSRPQLSHTNSSLS